MRQILSGTPKSEEEKNKFMLQVMRQKFRFYIFSASVENEGHTFHMVHKPSLPKKGVYINVFTYI